MIFGEDVERDARAHALDVWPIEACGVVSCGKYVRIENIADDKENSFVMPDDTWIAHSPEAVIHSHNAKIHPHHPTRPDMESQQAAAIPFGIVSCDGETTTPVLWWGDHTLDAPLEGRDFVPGIYDCYALVRAWYWQNRSVLLKDYPRNDEWWKAGENLLADYFSDAGFLEVDKIDAQLGDVLLISIRSPVPCHSAIYLGNNLVLHHLTGRKSVVENLSGWARHIQHVVRYAS